MILSSTLFSLTLLFSSIFSFAIAANNSSDKRIIYYYGTITEHGNHVSLLPLINSTTGGVVTNIYVATFDVSSEKGLNLNQLPLNDSSFDKLWSDKSALQKAGVKVQAMLLGNWFLFHSNESSFDASYKILSDGLKARNFDGVDLDIEDALPNGSPHPIGFNATVKLIDRLRADFGPDFLITMSPVASALWGDDSASKFSYKRIEQERGKDIAWYNGQFYNGFGAPREYDQAIENGFAPAKVVMGLSTNRANTRDTGGGYVNLNVTKDILGNLTEKYPKFGGVAGWEYMNSCPGGWPAPWKWSQLMAQWMGVTNTNFTAVDNGCS